MGTHGVNEPAYVLHSAPLSPVVRFKFWGFITLRVGLIEELCWKMRVLENYLGVFGCLSLLYLRRAFTFA